MNKSVKNIIRNLQCTLTWLVGGVARFDFIYVLLQLNKIFKAFWGKKVPDELKIQGQISRGNKRKKKNSTRPRAMLYSSSVTKLL